MDILNNLMSPASTPSPDQAAQVSPGDVAPAADPAEVIKAYPFLGELAQGKISGVVIPPGWKNPATKVISPQIIQDLGLVFYKPTNPKSGQLGIFNPKQVKHTEIRKLDKEGKLDEHFPLISNFVPSVGDSATGAPAVADAAPAAADASPGPSTGPVPVQSTGAGPGIGADAQDAVAKARTANLAQQLPSNRQVPGGGSVLNSLLKRAV